MTDADIAAVDAAGAAWSVERRTIIVRGTPRVLRLAHFHAGWVASMDTESGPTLGVDRSPYLAIGMAMETLDVGLAEVMALVGPVRDR